MLLFTSFLPATGQPISQRWYVEFDDIPATLKYVHVSSPNAIYAGGFDRYGWGDVQAYHLKFNPDMGVEWFTVALDTTLGETPNEEYNRFQATIPVATDSLLSVGYFLNEIQSELFLEEFYGAYTDPDGEPLSTFDKNSGVKRVKGIHYLSDQSLLLVGDDFLGVGYPDVNNFVRFRHARVDGEPQISYLVEYDNDAEVLIIGTLFNENEQVLVALNRDPVAADEDWRASLLCFDPLTDEELWTLIPRDTYSLMQAVYPGADGCALTLSYANPNVWVDKVSAAGTVEYTWLITDYYASQLLALHELDDQYLLAVTETSEGIDLVVFDHSGAIGWTSGLPVHGDEVIIGKLIELDDNGVLISGSVERNNEVFAFLLAVDVSSAGVTGLSDVRLPARFALHPIYPNPFNSSATVSFDLTRPAWLNLAVFDLLGREVTVLADGQPYAPGTHRVVWDASGLPGGTYFLRASTEDEQQVRRMLFLK
ncbi:T9SS type A sorting domain-containing protein [bacterium]|nr:T9SS type A sorting domain-containing protein [bacterium]